MTNENSEFVNQLINYCITNPNTTWDQIKNWFFIKKSAEGFDGENDD